MKGRLSAKILEEKVMEMALARRECSDLTGVTIARAGAEAYGRNWNVTHLRNQTDAICQSAVQQIAERLSHLFDLE